MEGSIEDGILAGILSLTSPAANAAAAAALLPLVILLSKQVLLPIVLQ